MAHLKKSAAGHLMRTATGHLSKECSGGEPWPPGNECKDCDPPLPDILYVTFSGLEGDFAVRNGKHALVWGVKFPLHPCRWDKEWGETDYISLVSTVDVPLRWTVWISRANGCGKEWLLISSNECDPTGAYPEEACDDNLCGDTGSCAASAGATAVVSLS